MNKSQFLSKYKKSKIGQLSISRLLLMTIQKKLSPVMVLVLLNIVPAPAGDQIIQKTISAKIADIIGLNIIKLKTLIHRHEARTHNIMRIEESPRY